MKIYRSKCVAIYWIFPAVIYYSNFYCIYVYHQWCMNLYIRHFASTSVCMVYTCGASELLSVLIKSMLWHFMCCVLANPVYILCYNTSAARWPIATYVHTHSTSVWAWYRYGIWCLCLKNYSNVPKYNEALLYNGHCVEVYIQVLGSWKDIFYAGFYWQCLCLRLSLIEVYLMQ